MHENEISKKKPSAETILKSLQKVLIDVSKHNSLENLQT